jgi:hypothetical protein
MTWGPFQSGDMDRGERKAQLRTLRLAVRLLTGDRGGEAAHRLLVAEVDCHPETLAEASAEFDRLASLDRRRILSAFASSLPTRACFPPAKPGAAAEAPSRERSAAP